MHNRRGKTENVNLVAWVLVAAAGCFLWCWSGGLNIPWHRFDTMVDVYLTLTPIILVDLLGNLWENCGIDVMRG